MKFYTQKKGVLPLQNEKLRNVAIIAHVDHGKTTLVDQMLKQGGVYRENQETVERVMDSNDLERERGITILAKNTAIQYGDTKINIVDTPGHADFGGEVERILKMVNGVILLVDAAEGPMPQTRFVLSRALELGHRVIVVVNKIDRPDQRIHEVIDEVLELLLDLDATPEQLDSPMLFCSARQGIASYSPDVPGTDLKPLFDTILSYIPAPEADLDQPFQMLVSAIDYNEFVGRIAIGRVERGVLKQNQEIAVCNYHDPDAPAKKAKAVSMYEFQGLGKQPITEATAGNIIAMSGIGDITIGDTICAPDCVEPLPFVKISAPTMEMTFSVNDSPYAGREGKFVTSRQLRDRLFRETLKDVSLRVTEIDGATDAFNVAGRGEMSLSILIETMRREGYEFQVSPPRVLYRTIDGKKCEPIERLVADVPSESVGAVIEKLGSRKGDLIEMTPVGSRMKLEFLIPARGLFGYRNEFLTDTRGEGIMASVFDSYAPYKGDLSRRNTGSLVSFETGESVSYGLFNAQERGALFIGPGVKVYEGMIVGVSPKQEDITVNVCKKKQMTNMRAAGSDEALRLVPPRKLSLEQCLEFLADDELLEVTPESLRMRKTILNHEKRMKATHGGKKK
jgi:GTP-binding protein